MASILSALKKKGKAAAPAKKGGAAPAKKGKAAAAPAGKPAKGGKKSKGAVKSAKAVKAAPKEKTMYKGKKLKAGWKGMMQKVHSGLSIGKHYADGQKRIKGFTKGGTMKAYKNMGLTKPTLGQENG